jgi:uncharacterized hydrophobic protein (TIGR00271 family)
VINLEVFGESAAMREVAELLDDTDGVSRVRLLDATRAGNSLVVAAVRPRVADTLLGELRRQGVPDTDITLSRIEVVARAAHDRAEASFVWEDVLGMAWLNARPLARYLAFMFVAGVVACYGVIERNVILIAGAMAISPDLLPITAVAVGLVGRRLRLVGQALLTLALGLAAASGAAALFALAQDWLDLIPSGFNIDATVLGSLTTVNDETIAVALAAGVAGMLALETRASSGVGVAISVTTIPAAAYLGVAVGLGELGNVGGALAVLGTNVAMLVVGASATLAFQRAGVRRAIAQHRGRPG